MCLHLHVDINGYLKKINVENLLIIDSVSSFEGSEEVAAMASITTRRDRDALKADILNQVSLPVDKCSASVCI